MDQRLNDPIFYGGINLLTVPGITITGIDTFRYPKRKVTTYSLANTNRSVTTSAFYDSRPINIRAIIARNTRTALDGSISRLRQILEPINQVLQLPFEGVPRQFVKTTVENIVLKDIAGGYIAVDIEIVSNDPYVYALTSTQLLSVANLTSGNKSYPIVVDGTADQAPVITYTVDSFTNGSNRTVTFINPLTDTSISVQRTWTAAEVLTIDCLNRTVRIAGVDTDFTGNFPEWASGNSFINYTDDFTARQVDIIVMYTKRYL